MVARSNVQLRDDPELLLAERTVAVHPAALRHGPSGAFLDAERERWRALRGGLFPPREGLRVIDHREVA